MTFLTFLICIASAIPVIAQSYNVYSPDKYKMQSDSDEKILFILDFSGSMTEKIRGKSKVDMMLETMQEILPSVNKNIPIGLRVYGNRMGFTAYDACKASSLLVPIVSDSTAMINEKLLKTHPRGMTPITYSLKKAIDSDFLGFEGKKHIILLSDGGENCDESPCEWAMELIKVRKDFVIDVIAFNINNREDMDQLKCTALVTTGKFYSAQTAIELADSLRKSLNTKKNVEAKILPSN